MKTFVAVSLSLVFFLLFLLGLNCTVVNAQEKVITMNYSNFWPAMHPFAKLQGEWCSEIEKRTNGRVKITLFASGTLTPPAQTYDSVVKGIADVGQSVLGYTTGRFPLTEGLGLPIGHKSGYSTTKLLNAYYNKFKPKEFDDVKLVYLHSDCPHALHTRKPVYKLEDFKGIKIRTSGITTQVIKALGGVPVAMPVQEAYDALSKGIVDGISISYEGMYGHKLSDVIHNTTEVYRAADVSPFFIAMNKKRWNSFSPEIQKIIDQVNAEFMERQAKAWNEDEKKNKEAMLKKGHNSIVLPPEEQARWAEKIKPILDDYVRDTKKLGLPGDEVLKFAMDYLKAN